MSEEITRESLELDVLFVGGGPATLAGAIRLADLVKQRNEAGGEPLALEIAVIEKGEAFGDHGFSGAVLDPVVLNELLPAWRELGCPLEKEVRREEFMFLTPSRAMKIPTFAVPREVRNHGYHTASLQKLVAWLATEAEKRGINLLPATTGVEVLYDGERVVGVRTGDKGLGKDGRPKPNFEPGLDLKAKITIFGEGPRGTLSEDLIARKKLREGKNPQRYSLGVKEVIRVEGQDLGGFVATTMGWPLRSDAFGGGFFYEMGGGHLALGLVVGLGWHDPNFDCHEALQELKKHPYIQNLIRGGEVVAYGAKTIPEGGYWSLPQVWTDGALLVGDSAGFVDVKRNKGIPHAMKSGMVAAEVALEAIVAGDLSAARLKSYWDRLSETFVVKDLWRQRNFRRAFEGGLYTGLAKMMFWDLTGGGSTSRHDEEPDYKAFRHGSEFAKPASPVGFDSKVLVDKLTDVYRSGTKHREDQPSHIQILDAKACVTKCMPRFGTAPCTHFCPASVYEMQGDGDARRIFVNFSNCVHCKTCGILDPCDVDLADMLQNIEWRAPAEGGPKYRYL